MRETSEDFRDSILTLHLTTDELKDLIYPLRVFVSQTEYDGVLVRKELEAFEENLFISLLTDEDFPAFFANSQPLDIIVKDGSGRIVFQGDAVLSDVQESITLELPLKLTEENSYKLPEEPEALVSAQAMSMLQGALWQFNHEEHEEFFWEELSEGLNKWLDVNLKELYILNYLADEVLAGDLHAMILFNEALNDMQSQFSEPIDLEAFMARVVEEIAEQPEIGERDEDEGPQYVTVPEMVLSIDRVTTIACAALFATGEELELGRRNLAIVERLLSEVRGVQVVYDIAMRTMRGEPGAYATYRKIVKAWMRFPSQKSVIPEPREWEPKELPRGPSAEWKPFPVDPKPYPPIPDPKDPKPYPPIPDPEDIIFSPKNLTKEWALKNIYRSARLADRYGATYDLYRVAPWGFESYSISEIVNAIGGRGSACRNETITIKGQGFGTAGGMVRLSAIVNSSARAIFISPVQWTDTEIIFQLPSNAISGGILLKIPWKQVTIGNVIKNLYKVGNTKFLSIPLLETQMTVQRLRQEPTGKSNSTELFHITESGKAIRADIARVEWKTKDALNGINIKRQLPGEHLVTVSTADAGSIDYPSSGDIPQDGTVRYELEASNRCDTSNKSVEADVVVGVKAVIESLTANGQSNLLVMQPNDKLTLKWKVLDSKSVQLVTMDYNRNKISNISVNFEEERQDIVPINAIYQLVAEGTIRKRKELVRDLIEVKVAVTPVIHSFSVDKKLVGYGESVTFSWNTDFATKVILQGTDGYRNEMTRQSSISVSMKNDQLFSVTYTLTAENSEIPSSHPSQSQSQSVTVKYKPTIEKFELVSFPARNSDGTLQPTQRSKSIQVSWGLDNNRGLLHQDWGINLKLHHVRSVQYFVESAMPKEALPNTDPKILITQPQLNKIYKVLFRASGPNGTVTDSGSAQYLKPVRKFNFKVTPINAATGEPSKIYSYPVSGFGRNEEEAKQDARKNVREAEYKIELLEDS